MKKQTWFLLLAAVFTALLLCGCNQYDGKYEDEAFLTDEADHYMAIMQGGNAEADGTYSLHAGSLSGVQTLRSFTVKEDDTLCEVTSTLTRQKGHAKLLVVDARERTLMAQWPLDSEDPMSVTLPAGKYELRVAGRSAGYDGTISLFLNGQLSPWDRGWKEVRQTATRKLTGGWKSLFRGAIDSLQETFGDEKIAV